MADLIYAATDWPTNAAMIQDVHRLGYLRDDDHVLDPTYGNGTWWRCWRPKRLSARTPTTTWEFHPDGLYEERPEKWNFCDMGAFDPMVDDIDEVFDAVAFDPPYVAVGGRTTTSIPGMHDAYGMNDAPLSPPAVQSQINSGLNECYRVVKRGGIVLVKVQDYVSGGKLFPGTFETLKHAYARGFQLVDRLEHISGPRPQPARDRQVHARRNYSTLFVLRRPKRGES